MKLTPVGIDIAKMVFQVHYVDEETGEIVNKPVKRAAFLEHFANRPSCLVGMEACGGAHHWARKLLKMGHQVKLMPAEFVKAFNIRNKNDAADARAIWLAVQQPSKAVAVKTEMQQGMLALHRMREWKKDDRAVKAISEIPGVGLLTATATVAMMGDAKAFRSGREFAAWAGLVPKQTGSGGKVNLHGISKRGDTYLRTLLIHGARSVLINAKDPGPWVEQMKQRRHPNVVTVALANRIARTIWAVLAHDRPYQKGYVSVKPALAVTR
jgi:transposase